MSEMRLIILGAGGRMGRTLIRVTAETPAVRLVAALEHPNSGLIGQDVGLLAGLPARGVLVSSAGFGPADADGILDFSTPAASLAALAAAPGMVHVIGTTGFSADDERRIMAAAQHTTIARSGNMSPGVK